MSQWVLGPVPVVAVGVAPCPVPWSSASSSMSEVGDRLTRLVYPAAAVRVSPNPESA